MASKQFIITLIDKLNNDLKVVNGQPVSDEFFVYKPVKAYRPGWRVVDKASGGMINKDPFALVKDAKDFAKNLPEDVKQQLEAVRQTDKYKAVCAKVADGYTHIEDLPLYENFIYPANTFLEAINNLDIINNQEEDQLYLF